MKVLVVEDHRALRGLLIEHLVQAGFAVDGAEDGRTAQALLEVGSYDAMILDLGCRTWTACRCWPCVSTAPMPICRASS